MASAFRPSTPLICAGLFLSIVATAASAQEGQCAQLVALEMQYRGVALTSAQKALKAQLLSWYRENCGRGHRVAKTDRPATPRGSYARDFLSAYLTKHH